MKRKILVFLGVVVTVWMGLAVLQPARTMALGGGNCGNKGFLGFRPWYDGLCNAENEIESPEKNNEADLTAFIWTIVLNVLTDLLIAIGYLALGFVIYGGYLYIMSQGDPGKVMKGKKTLINAIIGTVIALTASVVVNTGRVILGINASDDWKQWQDSEDSAVLAERIGGIVNWALAVAGIVAVIFIIKNAADYMLSQGDPGRVKKATQGIIYSVIGLVIVLLAYAITAFVVSSAGSAVGGSAFVPRLMSGGILG